MTAAEPITDEELLRLFAGMERTPLALAVSGGADSMALMHMIARWATRVDVRCAFAAHRDGQLAAASLPRDSSAVRVCSHEMKRPAWLAAIASLDDLRRTGGPPHVVVLTVDHGLRPEAAEEAAFVAREAQALALPCQILRWEGDKPATGIQAAAREARRNLLVDAVRAESEWLANLALPHGVLPRRTLVMAHHEEDQAETFLMRLARGSGLEGLSCMRDLDWISSRHGAALTKPYEVCVRRPLLGIAKARLVATLSSQGGRWIADPSNDDERFERVRVRKALGVLAEYGVTPDKIALSARRLADAEMSFVRLIDGAEPAAPPGPTREMFADIDLAGPDFETPYAACRLLKRMLSAYGGSARPAELSQVETLARRAMEPGSRSRIAGLTVGGCRLQPHGDGVRFLRIFREGSGEGIAGVPIAPGQTVEWDGGRFTLTADAQAPHGGVISALGTQGWADLKRAVKGLGDLGWPAAAVATLPVVVLGDAVIAYPAIDALVQRLPDEKRQTKERWAEFSRLPHAADYHASFNLVSRLRSSPPPGRELQKRTSES